MIRGNPIIASLGILACALNGFSDEIQSDGVREQRVRFSSAAFSPGGRLPYASVSGDGRTLRFDVETLAPKGSLTLFKSREGFFKPNTDYRLSFTYKIPKQGDGGRLIFRVRDMDSSGPDAVRETLAKTDDEKPFSARFRSPANAKRLAVVFTAADAGLEAEIKDLKVEYGNFEAYIPASPKAQPYEGEIPGTPPAGAREVSVELPQGNGSVISAEHLDVDPGLAYLATRINKAIETCRERGISKLILPRGRYYIDEDVAITLSNLRDFEFDGGGSTLVFKRSKGNSLSISGCERVKVSNVNFDWDWETDPLASFVKVSGVKTSEKESYVDFAFVDYRDYPKKYVRIACLSQADEQLRSVGVEGGKTYMWETWQSTPPKEKKWVSANVLRVYMPEREAGAFSKGEFYRMSHYYYDMNCVSMYGNRNLTLENVNVHSTPGHAFTVDGAQKYWRFKNVNIVIPEGAAKRAITCTADHLHIARSQGFFKMEDCEFSFGNDDCMNAHDNSDHVKKLGKKSVSIKNGKWRALTYKPGEKVEFRNADMSPTGFAGEVAEVAEIEKRPGDYRISFTEPLPEDISEFVIFNRTYDTSNIIVRNCVFRQNRARGLLILARDVTVENCRFYRNEMGAIKLESGWTAASWCEGFGVDNVVVRNCEFDTVNPSGAAHDGKVRDIFMGAYIKTDPSPVSTYYPIIQNVLFENNSFKDSFGLVAFISSARNVTFKGNTFANPSARNSENHYRGAFFITHSSNVNIVNNTYADSRQLKMPGVMYDRETCENILAEGNLIAKALPSPKEETREPGPAREREYSIPEIPVFIPGL